MARKIIVSGNYGKSIFSYYLGWFLTACKGKKVSIISPDYTYNPIDTLFFKQTQKSIGRILECPIINQDKIIDNLNLVFNNLGYFSYATGETDNSYGEAVDYNIKTFIDILGEMTDYIIFDQPGFKYDIGIVEAMCEDEKTKTINIISADSKGVSYRQSHKHNRGTIEVLTILWEYSPVFDIVKTFVHPPKHILPYSKELKAIYNTASIKDIPCPKGYKKVIRNIVEEIEDDRR